jgi:hypothetical protein
MRAMRTAAAVFAAGCVGHKRERVVGGPGDHLRSCGPGNAGGKQEHRAVAPPGPSAACPGLLSSVHEGRSPHGQSC